LPPRTRLRLIPPAPIAMALLAAVFAPLQAAERVVHVQGRILDPDGSGLERQTVRLFKTRRGFEVGGFSSGGQVAEAARVETDRQGFYEIRIPRDRSYDHYFLRFYDPQRFDRVRFHLPDDREITRDLRRREVLRVDVTLRWHETWPDVRRRLDAVGEDSPKGRVLRTMGLPETESTARGPEGLREEWWYHTRGVVYFFSSGKASGFRRFEPVRFASPLEGGP
jgi:hypothetical protein